jgi:hypothetical protein
MMTKQCYIHSSLDVGLCLPLHVNDRVENIFKHILFYVHDVKVMTEEIDLPIRKLSENTSLYPIMGQTKTRKLLLTKFGNQTECHRTLTRHHSILHHNDTGVQHSFKFCQ